MSSSLISISWFGSSGGGLPRRPGLKSLGRFFIVFYKLETVLLPRTRRAVSANFQPRHHDPEAAVFLHLPFQLLENIADELHDSCRNAGRPCGCGHDLACARNKSLPSKRQNRFCDLRLHPRIKWQWYDNRLSPSWGK